VLAVNQDRMAGHLRQVRRRLNAVHRLRVGLEKLDCLDGSPFSNHSFKAYGPSPYGINWGVHPIGEASPDEQAIVSNADWEHRNGPGGAYQLQFEQLSAHTVNCFVTTRAAVRLSYT
jgi:hypothetical protein